MGRSFDFPVAGIPVFSPGSEDVDQTIPPRVVQTWEVNRFGRRHKKGLLGFRARNPNLSFELLDRVARDTFMENFSDPKISQIYFDSKFGTMRSDIFRYAYLLSKGGYYCDISMNLSGRITAQHSRTASAVISFEDNPALRLAPKQVADRLEYPCNLMAIWLLGFTPEHPILQKVLDQIKDEIDDYRGKVFHVPKSAILALTGPAAFTRAVWSYLRAHSDLSVEFAGIDFNRLGHAHPGAGYRHLQFPSYSKATEEGLFLSE